MMPCAEKKTLFSPKIAKMLKKVKKNLPILKKNAKFVPPSNGFMSMS